MHPHQEVGKTRSIRKLIVTPASKSNQILNLHGVKKIKIIKVSPNSIKPGVIKTIKFSQMIKITMIRKRIRQ